MSHDICSRLLLTTSRHPGLGQVYEHVFGFEGNEFYMREWPQLANKTFGELVLAFPDAVPLGFRKRRQRDPQRKRIMPGVSAR